MIKTAFLYKRYTITFTILVALILFLSRCISHDSPVSISDNKGELFAGSSACISCHKNICDSFVHTAHYLTSRIADSNTIKGSFQKDKNVFVFGNSIVVMEKRNDSFYQVEYGQRFDHYTTQYEEVNSGRFDIVVGSNTKGQTYLSWYKNLLYQLPLSYFTVINNWCNSPGYPFRAVYNRSISSRCLECHSTYAQVITPPNNNPEEFDHNKIIYGIDCEKCHGAAARHVAYQSEHPNIHTAKYIVNPAKLTHQQSLDLCSLCHSGASLHNIKASFSYTAGDTISNYFTRDSMPTDVHDIDVHGNQYGLLTSSLCFKKSGTMTCNTCHNTHNKERGETVLFSQRCISCHNTKDAVACPLTASLGTAVISKNCIDCHMPLVASKSISVSLPGDTARRSATVRSHYISIYPSETDRILALIKNNNQH